ncbi:MAG: AraC family transcriptional regulator [Gammaproteobacteria bacterium]|nr:AraC family transcriptional regulator [Gammaproteobacteria bacterium]
MSNSQLHVVNALTEANATLKRQSLLGDGFVAACWHRKQLNDTAYSHPGHHTLSYYLAGGERVRRRDQPNNWGAPGKLCLLPAGHESYWEIQGEIKFLHLYIPPELFSKQIVQTLDAEPRLFSLADRTYMDDVRLSRACRYLTKFDWNDPQQRLSANALSHEILLYLMKTQTHRIRLPVVKGGLSAWQRRYIREWIETYLAKNITLAEMAEQLNLSAYHFAHMFRISFGLPPHRWVMYRRLQYAQKQLRFTEDDLLSVSLNSGFATSSHLSKIMKQHLTVTPGQYRIWSNWLINSDLSSISPFHTED